MAAEEGFEPSQTESESAVLPLHNSALRPQLYHAAAVLSRTFFDPVNVLPDGPAALEKNFSLLYNLNP